MGRDGSADGPTGGVGPYRGPASGDVGRGEARRLGAGGRRSVIEERRTGAAAAWPDASRRDSGGAGQPAGVRNGFRRRGVNGAVEGHAHRAFRGGGVGRRGAAAGPAPVAAVDRRRPGRAVSGGSRPLGDLAAGAGWRAQEGRRHVLEARPRHPAAAIAARCRRVARPAGQALIIRVGHVAASCFDGAPGASFHGVWTRGTGCRRGASAGRVRVGSRRASSCPSRCTLAHGSDAPRCTPAGVCCSRRGRSACGCTPRGSSSSSWVVLVVLTALLAVGRLIDWDGALAEAVGRLHARASRLRRSSPARCSAWRLGEPQDESRVVLGAPNALKALACRLRLGGSGSGVGCRTPPAAGRTPPPGVSPASASELHRSVLHGPSGLARLLPAGAGVVRQRLGLAEGGGRSVAARGGQRLTAAVPSSPILPTKLARTAAGRSSSRRSSPVGTGI